MSEKGQPRKSMFSARSWWLRWASRASRPTSIHSFLKFRKYLPSVYFSSTPLTITTFGLILPFGWNAALH